MPVLYHELTVSLYTRAVWQPALIPGVSPCPALTLHFHFSALSHPTDLHRPTIPWLAPPIRRASPRSLTLRSLPVRSTSPINAPHLSLPTLLVHFPSTSTLSHTFPLSPTGTCPYGRAWAGTPRKNNDHRQRIECSGQGVCERKTGQCVCKPGFWGEGCRRSACPNSCSGHGTCQSIKAFAEDYSHEADDGYVSRQFAVPSETEVYNSKTGQMEWIAQTRNAGARYDTAWDADYNYGCKCDQGFRGPDCSKIECPSLADPLGHKGAAEGRDCSGRGSCDYTTGVCECFRGFYGGSCEYMTNLA